MRITSYIKEVEPAVRALITELYREAHEADALVQRLGELEKQTEEGYAQVNRIIQIEEELSAIPGYMDDDPMLATAIYWDTYFGADKERHLADQELRAAMLQLNAHEFARNLMSGLLLQIAKQGISIRYGKKVGDCPEQGRLIKTQAMRDVIWQARNQAIHWEEGQVHPAVEKVFNQLATDFGPIFAQYNNRNLAFDVVVLLDWKNYEDFERDLVALDP